jgi:dolichyldiphosphatase
MKLKSLDVSNVMYLEGDKIGKLLAFLSLSPIFIMVFYVTLVVSRRELSVGFILLGQLLNELFNGILKEYWREPRPSGKFILF